MLQVKTYIASSSVNGIGLFAASSIRKGRVTWKFTPGFDHYINPMIVNKLPEPTREFVKTYCALSNMSHQYVLYGDDTRFTNHSAQPNIDVRRTEGEPEAIGIANRNIKKGEELTVDYRLFDEHDAASDEEYLKG